jgi:CDGSH-type Zn-finger protein
METKITILNNGPIMIEGETKLMDGIGADYRLAGKDKLFLCRCGHSNNKPFCDGSHKAEGFRSECSAVTQ